VCVCVCVCVFTIHMVMKMNNSLDNEKKGTLGSPYFTCFTSYSCTFSRHEDIYTSMWGVYVPMCEYIYIYACVCARVCTYVRVIVIVYIHVC